jgi:hypothetical protein
MNKFIFFLGGGGGGHFLDTKGGVQTKILGKKIGTLKAGGGKTIGPLARIYTPACATNGCHIRFCANQ